ALLSLLVQFVLPLWVMSGDPGAYESKLPGYHFWLGAASIIHLVTIAAWVLISERTVVQAAD
ncbi:MAG: hypothetical protein ABGZ53_34990, partial [Fuerstiella sp.]